MIVLKENQFSEEMRTYIIQIYSYQDKVLTGSFQNVKEQKTVHFKSFMQMLLQIEAFMEEHEYPQSSFQSRSFKKMMEFQNIKSEETAQNEQRTIATFIVKLLFRQHGGWQGTIGWEEQREIQSFRSILELARLIDSALC